MDPGSDNVVDSGNGAAVEVDVKAPVEDVAEILHPRPARTFTYWLVLFCAVLPVWSAVPLSWAFVIYALHTGAIWTFRYKGWAGFAVALAEVSLTVNVIPNRTHADASHISILS